MRYTGLTDARALFEDLRPLHARLLAMQGRLRPFGSDYLVLEAALKALTTAAYHFTREPDFYALATRPEPPRPAPARDEGSTAQFGGGEDLRRQGP